MHAVGRIAYRGAIENVQASWVKMGASGARQLLRAGCNDLGGTLMDENIRAPPAPATASGWTKPASARSPSLSTGL